MDALDSGGKFDNNSDKVSGCLHGVGVSVVNALSTWLRLKIWRNDQQYEAEFANGNVVEHIHVTGSTPGRPGPEVSFLPSPEPFTQTEFSHDSLERSIREKAFLNSGRSVAFIVNTGDERQ